MQHLGCLQKFDTLITKCMSIKKSPIASGINYTDMGTATESPPPSIHGMDIVCGGTILSGIFLVVFLICYCCHKKCHKKQKTRGPGHWKYTGPSHVYTIRGNQQCLESEAFELYDIVTPPPPPPPVGVPPGPPPAYEAVVPVRNILYPGRIRPGDNSGLPTYEAALRIENDYV